MVWTVFYRDKKGQQGKTEVEAENRAIVISQMRKRGLTVVSIFDAPDAVKEARRDAGRRATAWHRAFAALFFATVLAAAAWYFIVRDGAPGRGLLDDVRPSGPITMRVVGEGRP